jgi:sugar (pentulose or hexulose) kinase
MSTTIAGGLIDPAARRLGLSKNIPVVIGANDTTYATVGAGGASIEWFRTNFCKEMTRETFYEEYLKGVLSPNRLPEARFHPFLSGDRHRIRRKSGAFTRLTLNTTREDILLALIHGIISFHTESLSEWEKTTRLSDTICHVGGGARDAYTGCKQSLLNKYKFVQLGETTLTGAAQLAMDAMQ